MSKELTASFVVLVAVCSPAAAQITFDGAYLEEAVGEAYQALTYSLNVQHYESLGTIIEATGPDQTYDFSGFTFGDPTTFDYEVLSSPAGTPGEGIEAFEASNWVQVSNTSGGFYAYYELRDDGYYSLGSVSVLPTDNDGDGAMDLSVSYNDPPDLVYPLPLTHENEWMNSFVARSQTGESTGETPVESDGVVEGWGALITPMGSVPSLRLRTTHTTYPGEPFELVSTTIQFISNENVGASILLNADGDPMLGATAYSVLVTGSTAAEDVPQRAFRLHQNYPNPFSNSTTISFDLDRPGYVDVRVFDVTGREVRRPVSGHLPAGTHTAVLGADGLASGVYFYRMEADGSAQIRRLVVQR